MRRMVLAALAAWLCAVLGAPKPAVALELNAGVNFDYSYAQDDVGGEVNAATTFNQKYEIRYSTSLTSAFDFLGAVRLDLQDAWFTDQASTSQVAPTLEMATRGSQLAAKLAYQVVISSTDAYRETGDVEVYSDNLTLDLEWTPEIWPEVRLKYQRRSDYTENSKESTAKTFEFSTRKEIYNVRLEFNLSRVDTDDELPARSGSTGTTWSARATYKEILWGGAAFELGYEINEDYTEQQTRGVFAGESSAYTQLFKTRLKNSLAIGPRMTLGLAWEYQFDQDLLALDFDYKVKNKYVLDLRWDAYDWLKFVSEARHETDLVVAVDGAEDDRTRSNSFRAAFDFTSISWLQINGKAEFRNDGKIVAETGGSVNTSEEEKFELVAKNIIEDYWDLTLAAATSSKHENDVLTNRETRARADLKLRLYELSISPSYEVTRTDDWERNFDYPISQKRTQEARIRFNYEFQLLDMFKAAFSHEYSYKVDESLDEVLNFGQVIQFNESTRLTIVLGEFVRDMNLAGEFERRASDTEDDADPEIVELSYGLKLDWKFEDLILLSSIRYNDKGDTFDDLTFNARAGWKVEQLELSGEYQFNKTIKDDDSEPKEETRLVSLRLNYQF